MARSPYYYPSKAMAIAIFLMGLRMMKLLMELRWFFDSNPVEARMFGFPVEYRHVPITTANNLRHFDKMRMRMK